MSSQKSVIAIVISKKCKECYSCTKSVLFATTYPYVNLNSEISFCTFKIHRRISFWDSEFSIFTCWVTAYFPVPVDLHFKHKTVKYILRDFFQVLSFAFSVCTLSVLDGNIKFKVFCFGTFFL